ncbi:hypothetical protein H4219_001844 [Mycoemilia scoparia]|uniref:RRM domain-containing protein n=1 Tax=Mycoemilia scoparia TaxID=417184 RepID=A0A9W8DV60_9FUNG|nr:hypothetical protein H4219_001844 [Mycoemilia scoparia]
MSGISGNAIESPDFPDPGSFDSDPRVHLIEETGAYVFTNPKDGIQFEYDKSLSAWFPMWNEELVETQQSIYTVNTEEDGKDEQGKGTMEEKNPATRKRKGTEQRKHVNTSVYVTGLPKNTDEDEVAEYFKKCGTIMPDLVTNKPKVKLYRDESGNLKGDALVTYFKEASVELALSILDESQFRDSDPERKLGVQVAEFKEKKERGGSAQSEKKPRIDQKLIRRKLENMEKSEDVTLLIDLKQDIREECEKLGEVTNVKIYDKEPEGVVSVKFKDKFSATACVKVMNGRFFAGRQVIAAIYDGKTKYRATKKNEETEEETEKRIENYAQWLESRSKDTPNLNKK